MFCVKNFLKLTVFTTILVFCAWNSFAQSDIEKAENQKLTDTILHLDSLFWKTYNECDIQNNGKYLADNVQFFHDKGGITTGRENLVNSIKNGLCSNPNYHLRREAVEGSVQVFPLRNKGAIYGAIILGEHYFYVKEGNKTEFRDGLAKFNQLWQLQNGEWKMTYIQSYDHKPAPFLVKTKELNLSSEQIAAYEGKFSSPKFGEFSFKPNENTFLLEGKGFKATLFPKNESTFFMKERDLQFEFVKDATGKFNKIKIYEKGVVVDELVRF